ncbi:prolipoprotein diacylglyceryl transferase [Candidatus Peregrinibacteria bacterium]|nr:prolipoprotein diacylglyceryl transferase [Candidatus Peregrinibacteria bacterium]
MFQAFELGPFLIWTRLLFVLAGIWLSTGFFLRLAESANLSLQHFRDNGWQYALTFVLGGRIAAMLASYKVYLQDPLRSIFLHDGNFSFLGGAIGIGAALYFATRGQRTTFLQWLDALLPAATLGLVFSWMGSFFAGDAYGAPTDAFWGVVYDTSYVRYTIPLHPVQLYYALFYFLLTFILLIIRKRSRRVGAETLFGIVTASIGAFVLEYFRGDFSIPVFATALDFGVITFLFASLGVFALIENRISARSSLVYEICLLAGTAIYVFARAWLDLDTFELRASQLLSVLALLVTVVYVVVERRKHPYF